MPIREARPCGITSADTMIEELLRIYEQGRINPRPPQYIFPETLLFNEGWTLRAAIHSLRSVQVPAWLEG